MFDNSKTHWNVIKSGFQTSFFKAYVTWVSMSNFFIPLIVLIFTNASVCITIWKTLGKNSAPKITINLPLIEVKLRVDFKLSTFGLIWNLPIFTSKSRSGFQQFKILGRFLIKIKAKIGYHIVYCYRIFIR